MGDTTEQTTTQENTLEPKWYKDDDDFLAHGEPLDFVLSDHDQFLQVQVYDEDKGALDSDDLLGTAQVTVGELLLTAGKGGDFHDAKPLELLTEESKSNGATIHVSSQLIPFDSVDLSSLQKAKLYLEDKIKARQNPNMIYGYVTIIVLQAHHVPIVEEKKEEVALYVQVTCGGELQDDDDDDTTRKEKKKTNVVGMTATIKDVPGLDCRNPIFDVALHLPLTVDYLELVQQEQQEDGDGDGTMKNTTVQIKPLKFEILNESPVAKKAKEDATSLGSLVVTHETLVNAPDRTLTEKSTLTTTTTTTATTTTSSGDDDDENNKNKEPLQLEYRVLLRGLQEKTSGSAPLTTTTTATTETNINTGNATATEPEGAGGEEEEEDNAETSNLTGSTTDTAGQQQQQMVRVTVVKGHGFHEEKKTGMFKKNDIPDIYCNITFGSSPTIWRTTTIKNSLAPTWNNGAGEYKNYHLLNHAQIIHVTVYDEDSGNRDDDDILGKARITIGKLLLAGGRMDIELELEGRPTGSYITMSADLV